LTPSGPRERGGGEQSGPTVQSVTDNPCAGSNKPAARRGGAGCPGE
jgi:hypothetical protein